jgi:hypothetical protein
MRRLLLALVVAAGLGSAASGTASAQAFPPFGFPGGIPGGIPGGVPGGGLGFPFGSGYPVYQGYTGLGVGSYTGPGYGGGPYGTVPDPGGYGFPASYQYPYGYPFGTPPYYGLQGGIGFTFNSLNYAPFSTVAAGNSSTIPGAAPGGGLSMLTILPLSAIGRVSMAPTQTTSYNQVIIR